MHGVGSRWVWTGCCAWHPSVVVEAPGACWVTAVALQTQLQLLACSWVWWWLLEGQEEGEQGAGVTLSGVEEGEEGPAGSYCLVCAAHQLDSCCPLASWTPSLHYPGFWTLEAHGGHSCGGAGLSGGRGD